jgi:hypothetical protein
MNDKPSYHVVRNLKGGWIVRSVGSSRCSGTYADLRKAVEHARKIAKARHAELYVHGADGTIRERDSYGADPSRPIQKWR